tara:strand:+ start:11057 stop:12655 length:1599 start_codon:yes stop_codon:yes gene_type:complete
MPIPLEYYTISLFSGGVIALLAGFLPYLDNSSKAENKAWLLLNVSSAIWSFGYYSMITATSSSDAMYSNIILHGAAVFIPLFYLLFVLHLTDTYRKVYQIFYAGIVVSLFFFLINPSVVFVKEVIPKHIFNYAPEPGFMYIYFTFYFFVVVSYAIYILYKAQLDAPSKERLMLRFVLYSSLAGFIGGGGVFLLTYNILPPFLLVLFTLYPIIIAYAMIRHEFLEIKVIVTEIFIALLWLLLLFRIFAFGDIQDKTISAIVFIAALILGISVIRSVVQEVKIREELEKITKQLKSANDRLEILDQQKSEFLSIATHQLRGPIAGIRGHLSLILDGSYGKIPNKARTITEKIFESSGMLAQTINDFLNVSRIEQGSMQYDMSDFAIHEQIADIVTELQPIADERKLKLTFKDDCADASCIVHADKTKLNHIFFNLIENAIKYTEKGWVRIRIAAEHGTVRVSITDSGVGISKAQLPALFEKFVRAEGASKVNVNGTGLGLYVARQMVEAHKGKIWAESEGEGKGSTFVVELPSK